MKPVKMVVLGASLLAVVGVFLEWVSVSGSLPKVLASTLPRSGMDNGGPIFLFLLAMPLLAAGIGLKRPFGRGFAGLSLFGALGATFFALVKYSDIEEAGREVAKVAKGVSVSAGFGYWIFFVGAAVAMVASVAGLIKPERPAAG